MDLGIQIVIFRPGPPQRYRWFRMLWRLLLRKPPDLPVPLFKAILDARTLGLGRGPDKGCDHDVCFCRYGDGGGVVAGGLRYLGFRIIPDVVDVETIVQ